MQEQSQSSETGVSDGPSSPPTGPTASVTPKLPEQIGDISVIKDDGRRVELIALARSIGDIPGICESRGFKYLDATRFNHATGAAPQGRLQLPVRVVVKTEVPTESAGPEGLELIEVDAWYWRVKASHLRGAV